MKPIPEKYPFVKFWDAFMRQDRCVSKWDDKRTDQDIFINRTLSKWFEGKYFQVIFDKYIPGDPFNFMAQIKKEPSRIRYTMYMAIVRIRFGFGRIEGEIIVEYVEPHSTKIQSMHISHNDWYNMSAEEDKESFVILRRFYPVERIEIKLPTLA